MQSPPAAAASFPILCPLSQSVSVSNPCMHPYPINIDVSSQASRVILQGGKPCPQPSQSDACTSVSAKASCCTEGCVRGGWTLGSNKQAMPAEPAERLLRTPVERLLQDSDLHTLKQCLKQAAELLWSGGRSRVRATQDGHSQLKSGYVPAAGHEVAGCRAACHAAILYSQARAKWCPAEMQIQSQPNHAAIAID